MENTNRTVDMAFIKSLTRNNNVLIVKYINMFLDSTPQEIELIKNSWQNQNWGDLKKITHTIKPKLCYMGVKPAEEIIKQIEEMAGDNSKMTELSELISKAEIVLNAAIKELETERNFLNNAA